MVDIDLSHLPERGNYSETTRATAMRAISLGMVVHVPGTRTARCQSLSDPRIWEPAATLSSDGRVVGVTCNCPKGHHGGMRARCWHAAALEHIITERTETKK